MLENVSDPNISIEIYTNHWRVNSKIDITRSTHNASLWTKLYAQE